MPQLIPFTSAAKQHREKIIGTLTWTPGGSATLLTSGANAQIKAYPYLRYLNIHVWASGGTGGTLAADAPWNALSSIIVTDSNGSAIYGSAIFNGFDAFLVQTLGGYKPNADARLHPSYAASASSLEFWLRIPLEFNAATGAGSLPNMSSAAQYGLQLYGNTSASIWQTAPTTIPTMNVDVWMECWTLPDPADLLGRNQMQGPPLLGTTQYVTKQQYTGLTASGANTITLTRKGNMVRKWILVGRNSSGARIAATAAGGSIGWAPNPFEFWWNANRLTADDPEFLLNKMFEELDGMIVLASSVASFPAGVLVAPYDFSAPYGVNSGLEGEGGWLATTQSSRLEFIGASWGGSSFASLDVLTLDVAPVALANQYALDTATGKLLFPAQPEART